MFLSSMQHVSYSPNLLQHFLVPFKILLLLKYREVRLINCIMVTFLDGYTNSSFFSFSFHFASLSDIYFYGFLDLRPKYR